MRCLAAVRPCSCPRSVSRIRDARRRRTARRRRRCNRPPSRLAARTFDRGELPLPPARHLAIVTCMDAGILPARAFGLQEGDAHVIRNAGGRARDALRSLIISQRLLGTREVAVVHHTDCGMLTFNNRELRAKVQEDLRQDTGGFDFPPFTDLEDSVREDIEFLQATQLLDPATVFPGFVYDVRRGRLTEVRQEVEAGVEA